MSKLHEATNGQVISLLTQRGQGGVMDEFSTRVLCREAALRMRRHCPPPDPPWQPLMGADQLQEEFFSEVNPMSDQYPLRRPKPFMEGAEIRRKPPFEEAACQLVNLLYQLNDTFRVLGLAAPAYLALEPGQLRTVSALLAGIGTGYPLQRHRLSGEPLTHLEIAGFVLLEPPKFPAEPGRPPAPAEAAPALVEAAVRAAVEAVTRTLAHEFTRSTKEDVPMSTEVADTLARIQADVAQVKTVNASAVTLMTRLKEMLETQIASAEAAGMTPELLQGFKDVALGLENSTSGLASAVLANTPAGGIPPQQPATAVQPPADSHAADGGTLPDTLKQQPTSASPTATTITGDGTESPPAPSSPPVDDGKPVDQTT